MYEARKRVTKAVTAVAIGLGLFMSSPGHTKQLTIATQSQAKLKTSVIVKPSEKGDIWTEVMAVIRESVEEDNAMKSYYFDRLLSLMGMRDSISDYIDTLADAQSSVSEQLNTCGNGVIDSNEECDDGNRENEDGCSEECRVEYPATVTPGTGGVINSFPN